MNKLLTADIPLAPPGGFKGFGKLGLQNTAAVNAPTIFSSFLSSTIGVITIVAFIWFVFILFTGAIGIMTAGADKNALEGAKKKITMGLIGVVVVIAGIFIMDLIGFLFGIQILDITSLINLVGIK